MESSVSKLYWFNGRTDFVGNNPEELWDHLADLFKEVITTGIQNPDIDMVSVLIFNPQKRRNKDYEDLLEAYARAVTTFSEFSDLFTGCEPLKQIISIFETYGNDKTHPKDKLKSVRKILQLFTIIERNFDDDEYDEENHEFIK